MDKGLKILFNTYWGTGGWKPGTISKEDFSLAKEEGYMFDYPSVASHDETLTKIKEVSARIDKEEVANAFLYSLSTRRLEYRSALGSYWYAVAIPQHSCTGNLCYLCQWSSWSKEPKAYDLTHGLNVLNFERYKWGGVRQTHVDYALFDLQQFLKLPKVTPTPEDKKILDEILQCVFECEPHNKAGKLQQLTTKKKILKSNKSEVDVLLNILGICGVLSSSEDPCYVEYFPDAYGRGPLENTNDRLYPVNRWKASHGINDKRYEIVFGTHFSPQ